MTVVEPLFHSGITDELPEDHPLAQEGIFCQVCREMVHAGNNENMQPWLETDSGAYCPLCYMKKWWQYNDEVLMGLGLTPKSDE